MCHFKSALVLKDRVFVPDYDSHEDMIQELSLNDDTNTPNFVRVELSPVSFSHKDILALSDWTYLVDQDYLPRWYVPSYDEQRVRAAISKWFDAHCWKADQEKFLDIDMQKECTYFIFGEHAYNANYIVAEHQYETRDSWGKRSIVTLSSAPIFHLYDNTYIDVDGYMKNNSYYVSLHDSAKAYVHDVTLCAGYDNSCIYVYGQATAICYNQSSCKARGESVVFPFGGGDIRLEDYATAFPQTGSSSAIKAYHCSRVVKSGFATVDNTQVTLYDSAVCQIQKR